MKKSKVLWIHPQAAWQKLKTLFNQNGIKKDIGEKEIVAIKMHFGELGNIRYIHPTIARKIVDLVKEAGGRPFLTDTTTLYRHARQTLFDYLDTAAKNGFTSESMNCPIIIADGMRGTNGQWVELKSYSKFKKVKVAQAIIEADFLISLAHITFHPDAGFSAAVKNVAMGCTTKETKLAMHSSEVKPIYNEENCTLCMQCVRVCPAEAFYQSNKKIIYNPNKCIGCGECIAYCPSGAITVPWSSTFNFDLQRGLMDGFQGVVSTFSPRKIFFINVGFDITPHCDCMQTSKLPIVPDIGILASRDAIACDKASFDLIKKSCAYPGSEIDKKGKGGGDDKVAVIYPDIDTSRYWKLCQDSGLGNLEYELEVIS